MEFVAVFVLAFFGAAAGVVVADSVLRRRRRRERGSGPGTPHFDSADPERGMWWQ